LEEKAKSTITVVFTHSKHSMLESSHASASVSHSLQQLSFSVSNRYFR